MGEIVVGKNQDGTENKITVPDEFLDIGYQIKEKTANYTSQVSASGVTARRLDQIVSAFNLDTQGKKIKFSEALNMAKGKINSSGDIESTMAENEKLKEQLKNIGNGDGKSDELQRQVAELLSTVKDLETEKKKLVTEFELIRSGDRISYQKDLIKTRILQEATSMGLHDSEKNDFGYALDARFDINIDGDDVKFVNKQNGNEGYVTNKDGGMASAKDIAGMMKEMKPLVFAPPPSGSGTSGSSLDGNTSTKGSGLAWDSNEK